MLAKVFNLKCFWWCFFISFQEMSSHSLGHVHTHKDLHKNFRMKSRFAVWNSDLVYIVIISLKKYFIISQPKIIHDIEKERLRLAWLLLLFLILSIHNTYLILSIGILWCLLLIFTFMDRISYKFFVVLFLS